MDGRDLTTEEIMEQGKKLADKIGVPIDKLRFYTDPGAVSVMCNQCEHRQKYKGHGIGCDAYPNGIPSELIRRKEHDTPFEGDNGIRFKPVNK